MKNEIIKYAQGMNCAQDVFEWIEKHLSPFLEKNKTIQLTEVEHIVDYFASEKRPKRLSKMSYEQAKNNTDKWNKSLIKKGAGIKENASDVELIKDFGDGFKIVKLVGKAAYEREGFLMRHCVSSYFGLEKEVYSLRDKDNMPHATLEEDQQIKGKGNGSVSPKYIRYIVAFLEEVGMKVGDSEMKNLGYINVERIKDKLHKEKNNFYANKYLYENDKWINLEGKEYCELDILDYRNLINVDNSINFNLKIAFNLSNFIPNAVRELLNILRDKASGDYSKLAASGNGSKLAASGDYSKLAASGNGSKLAASGNGSQLAASGNDSQLAASGDYSQLAASGNDSKLAASGNDSKLAASGNDSQLAASGDYSKLAASGDYSQLAASGDYSKLAASGNDSKLAASGNGSKLAASGEYSKLAASGDYSQLAASGNYSQLAASGNDSKLAASGNGSKLAASGNYSQLAASGNDSKLAASGNDSIAISSGLSATAKAGKNGCIALTRWCEEEKRYRVSVGYVGENIKEDTWYKLDSVGNFIETN
jgi:hypothetical protein